MTKPSTFTRPELAVFHTLGTGQGWKPFQYDDETEVRFGIETSPTDEVTLQLQDAGSNLGGLFLSLTMYPEAELADATPQHMAATAARWLRDTAAKLEAVAAVKVGA